MIKASQTAQHAFSYHREGKSDKVRQAGVGAEGFADFLHKILHIIQRLFRQIAVTLQQADVPVDVFRGFTVGLLQARSTAGTRGRRHVVVEFQEGFVRGKETLRHSVRIFQRVPALSNDLITIIDAKCFEK